jgi:hypothetical protein
LLLTMRGKPITSSCDTRQAVLLTITVKSITSS